MASHTMILDLGTASVKAGICGESLPSVVFPTVVGIPSKRTGLLKKKTAEPEAAAKSHYIGHEAIHHMNRASLQYPVEHGIVQNWPIVEQVLNHTFEELSLSPDETGVVLTIPPYNPKPCTEQLVQTLFEAFGVMEIAVVPSGVCALYASGRTTGLVLDSGEGVTHVTPVFDSFIVQSAANRLNYGGKQITDHLKTIMFERGFNFTTPQDELLVRKLKEETCYVSLDYEADMKLAEDGLLANFDLPDGQSIQVGKERFRAPEILFNPSIVQNELPAVQEFVSSAVKGCGIDIRKSLLGNIVLCGGNTLFPGYAKRLEVEVLKTFPGLFGYVKLIESSDRLFGVWAGASVVASLGSFQSNVVTREVYDEHGPAIVHNYRRNIEQDDDDDGPPPPPPS